MDIFAATYMLVSGFLKMLLAILVLAVKGVYYILRLAYMAICFCVIAGKDIIAQQRSKDRYVV